MGPKLSFKNYVSLKRTQSWAHDPEIAELSFGDSFLNGILC